MEGCGNFVEVRKIVGSGKKENLWVGAVISWKQEKIVGSGRKEKLWEGAVISREQEISWQFYKQKVPVQPVTPEKTSQ